ncbi:MAG: NADH-quinone oxidoreductase subunit M, partial [Ferrovibrionaceae bacterium]
MPLLTITTFLPLVGAFLILLSRGDEESVARSARWIALWTTVITFAVSLLIWIKVDSGTANFQYVEHAPWFGETIG